LYTETSSLRTLKIMSRNLNEIVRSWIRLQGYFPPGITLSVETESGKRGILLQKDHSSESKIHGEYTLHRIGKLKYCMMYSICIVLIWSKNANCIPPRFLNNNKSSNKYCTCTDSMGPIQKWLLLKHISTLRCLGGTAIRELVFLEIFS
jgi:hypothetical protein